MLTIRLFAIALLSIGLSAGTTQAQVLYQGNWIAESFGNDNAQGTAAIETEDAYFSILGVPMGHNCNAFAPACDFASTPTDGSGVWSPRAGRVDPNNTPTANCRALTISEVPRPAKAATATSGVPPLYRNPAHFKLTGMPKTSTCYQGTTVSGSSVTYFLSSKSNDFSSSGPNNIRGVGMKGAPLTGYGKLLTNNLPGDSFKFAAAAASPTTAYPGIFQTTTGSYAALLPYVYSYTYATFRNDKGTFAAGSGFFSNAAATATLSFPYKVGGGKQVGNVIAKRGANRFGGVMKLLGKLTAKACYYYAGGCSLGSGIDWQYQRIGGAAPKGVGTLGGSVVTSPDINTETTYYYNTALGSKILLSVIAERFPWTTGNVTLTLTGRGPHRTIERRHGGDNRVDGIGTVQLVSPIMTHWLGASDADTGGIAFFKVRVVPEPAAALGLLAGVTMLGVLYRFRVR